jgi:hypothetical protein
MRWKGRRLFDDDGYLAVSTSELRSIIEIGGTTNDDAI